MRRLNCCCQDEQLVHQRQEEELKRLTEHAVPLLSTDFVKSHAESSAGVPTVIHVWGKRALLHEEALVEPVSASPHRRAAAIERLDSLTSATAYEEASARVQSAATPLTFTSLGSVRILQAAVGASHALFLSAAGQVFVLGVGERGQLGLGKERLFVTQPEALPPFEGGVVVSSVVAGLAHSAVLTVNGEVYAWGQADCVGDGRGLDRDVPCKVQLGPVEGPVTLVAAAFNQTMAVTEGRELLIWGEAFFSQFFLLPHCSHRFEEPVKQIVIGRQFAIAVLDSGKLLGWGDSTYCELGRHKGASMDPSEIPLIDAQGNVIGGRAVAAAAGARHSLVLLDDGRVCSFGDNLAGQCGLPSHIVRAAAPQLVQLTVGDVKLKAQAVYAGPRHSAVVTLENKLLTWGHASSHKLVHTAAAAALLESRYAVDAGHIGVAIRSGLKECVHKPTLVYSLLAAAVCAVALGDDFTLIVTGDGCALPRAIEDGPVRTEERETHSAEISDDSADGADSAENGENAENVENAENADSSAASGS